MKISHNLEENVSRLIETKMILEIETNPEIIKVSKDLKKYLKNVLDMSSSSSDSGSE